MTKPFAFTAAAVRRAIAAVQSAGLPVTAVRVDPEGGITIYNTDIAPKAGQETEPRDTSWDDFK